MAYGKSIGKGNFQPGFRLLDGQWLTNAFIKMFEGGISRRFGIVAKAGGTKAAAVQLDRSFNQVDTCATNDDSVLLPKAIAGSMVTVINNGAARLGVYGTGADTINGAATATIYNIAAGKTATFTCAKTGAWFANLSA